MNDISKGRSTSTASRISRGVGAAALSAVLIAGMAGCMTGKLTSSEPVPAERRRAGRRGPVGTG